MRESDLMTHIFLAISSRRLRTQTYAEKGEENYAGLRLNCESPDEQKG